MIQLRSNNMIVGKPFADPKKLAQEERALRRRLLFRMLNGHKFDGSITECARKGDTRPKLRRKAVIDDFVFA